MLDTETRSSLPQSREIAPDGAPSQPNDPPRIALASDTPGDELPVPPTRSKGRARKIALLVPVLLLAGGAFAYLRYDKTGRYIQDTNDATIQADQVTISSKLAGYVRSVAVSDNQLVNASTPLVEIDPADLSSKVRAADAGIASAVAAQRTGVLAHLEAEAEIGRVRAALQAAQAARAFAAREVTRYRPLVASGAEPASILSQLNANVDRANADIAAQQAALIQASRHVQTVQGQSAELSSQTNAARVQRAAAMQDLASTRLAAPISGRVANRSVRVGQFVQPGMRLMTIVPSQDIYVVANFKETQIGLMRPGLPAKVRADALPGVEFAGEVTSVTPGTGANFSLIPPQNATGNFTKVVQRLPVRIRINPGPAARRVLVPGLSLEVEVDTRANRQELEAIEAEQRRASK